MKKRKLIGVITALPESIHSKRILKGVFTQCEKYGYSVAVFSPMIQVCFEDKVYLKGETNIFELINCDLLDGIIVDTHSVTESEITDVAEYLSNKIKANSDIPIVAIDKPFGNYPCIKSDDKPTFKKIIEHFIKIHNCTDMYFLSGTKGTEISEDRVRFFKEIMAENGLDASDNRIFYGDFWYTGGAILGDRIISGEVRMPQAIICASDHMALGLVNRLCDNGYKIPEDVMISGFEATQEAALNDVSVSSFEANQTLTASKAVDYLMSLIEPDLEIQPLDTGEADIFHPGQSCTCDDNHNRAQVFFKDSFYYLFRDYGEKGMFENIDIGQLMEGYIPEKLTNSESPEKCLEQIYMLTYYALPYKRFYLCLRDDWLMTENQDEKGYPEKMNIVVHNTPVFDTGYHGDDSKHAFETKLMLPDMLEEGEPSVFYFSPVHFQDNTFGYAVLEREIKNGRVINLVYRNWLRFVNTSLEMIRAKNKLLEGSIRDTMTEAYNRRGMDIKLEKMLSKAEDGDKLFVCIVDMDNLKYINDNFGHTDGDFGIKKICDATLSIMGANEFCVRAGGDEFYLIGVGDYDEEIANQKVSDFYKYLAKDKETNSKVYKITASAGYEIAEITENMSVARVINSADAKMYRNKYERKKNRV